MSILNDDDEMDNIHIDDVNNAGIGIQLIDFRFHSEDVELCYGHLYFDRIYNVVNIKYNPHIPYRYNFINRTLTVDELDDNVFLHMVIFKTQIWFT